MKRWVVETRATVRRVYILGADTPKEAEARSVLARVDHEEDLDEETISIAELVSDATTANAWTRG